MSAERRVQEEQLQEEIEVLRGELGETVEALVHKADVPARVKKRGDEWKEEALERGIELHQQAVEGGSALAKQAVERGSELTGQAIERGNEWKALLAEGGSELRERARDGAQRTREALGRMPGQRWAKLAVTGLALITVMVLVRRVRQA